MNTPENKALEIQLVPIAEVCRRLGYRDPRNFRVSVAPRIGLAVVRVGLRWFVAERDFVSVMNSVTAATNAGEVSP